ncbi:MAG: hypothetical protein CVT71_01275 [Alphaproteobacteria bacterium HGW-Alphaproteobacteria-10]|jgi:ABC-type lipoprotein release transport system permease subunit|nr:MAG: hypothetical protein CVT71_01275 [Alphaproteobacteria bacterium HGW-Alphaproteobacteria-10]
MKSDPGKSPQRFGADLVLPVAASIYAVYYVASVWSFPPEAQRSGLFLAGLLLSLTTVFFIRTAVGALRGGWRFDVSPLLGPYQGRGARLAFLGLILLYLAVVRHGGFTLTTFGFILASSLVVGLRPLRRAAAFAAVCALGGWLFFIVLLGTRFPEGPFERLIHALAASWT